MDSSIIVALISAVVTIGNVAFTTWANKKQKKSEDEQAIEEGLQSLLRLEIIRSHDKYTEEGYCPIYAKESLHRAYDAYHKLGGNDIATELYKTVIALPEHPHDEDND